MKELLDFLHFWGKGNSYIKRITIFVETIMWSRFLGRKGMEDYTNEELVEYRRALRRYKKLVVQHCHDYLAEAKVLDSVLKDRLDDLEYASLEAEEDRINSDVNYWGAQTWVH